MATAKKRPVRTPIGSRNLLTTDQRAGYKRRWVNDEPGRIEAFLNAGYAAVEKAEVGDPVAGRDSQLGTVVERSVGAGKRAVLMEISEEFYAEDQGAKEASIRKSEEAMLPADDETFNGKGVTISRSLEKSKLNYEGD